MSNSLHWWYTKYIVSIFIFLENKVLVSKSGTMKYKEERNIIISTGFHSRYFILDSRFFKMFKDIRVSSALYFWMMSLYPSVKADQFCSRRQKDRAEQEWEVKFLKIYVGVKKKLRPPTRLARFVILCRCHSCSFRF